jgi:glycosyltransferase involved in cell wall biosynthesis
MKKKIKVLECIRQGQIGGGESHLLSLVENLDRSLFEPVVLSFTDGPMIDRLTEMKVENHVIHTTRPFDVTKWKQVKKFLAGQQVDIVHAHGTRANSNVLWAAKKLKLPVIYTVHGWSFHQDQKALVKSIRIMGERYLTSRADLNISVSASNQQTGKKNLGSFDSVVINNGIDQKKFDPSRNFKDIRQELNISQDAILVLFIARFTGHKQPLTLIKSFQSAVQSDQRLHLLMVGDGDQKQQAVDMITQAGLDKKITLLPFRQDVPDILAAADIFVLPSLWEGLPIGLLEAMAMGKAVIASNVDGTSEVVDDQVNGILIETENLTDNLAKALIKLANDPAMRQTFRQKAIETVNERYNAETMTRRIEKIYTDLVIK